MLNVDNQNKNGMADCTIRVGPLTNIEPLLRSLDCEPRAIIEAAGLSTADLLDIDHRLPYTTATRLIEHCAKASGCNHFGLLLGQRYLLTQLGIAGQLAYTAMDVASALNDIISNYYLHDEGGILTLDKPSRYTSFSYTIVGPVLDSVEQAYDLSTTVICGTMRSLCGMDWNPVKVELSRPQPKYPQLYKDYFRAPVQFNAPNNTVKFFGKCLNNSLASSDIDYHTLLTKDAHALHNAMSQSLSWKVRATLRPRLAMGENTASGVAETLGLHERTLHRRLQLEGTSFRKLQQEVRQAVSHYYLSGTALSIKEIALILGYGTTDAFDHAFQRWFGCSPMQWRKSLTTQELAVESRA
jgi:AraC-like DNA-binding protein